MSRPICTVCGRNPASYVCQSCGRTVCGNCFDASSWYCTDCRTKAALQVPEGKATVSSFPMASWLFLISFAFIFIGALLVAIGSLGNTGNLAGGTIILIGPIPIIIGTGSYSTVIIGLGLALTILSVLFYVLLRRRQ